MQNLLPFDGEVFYYPTFFSGEESETLFSALEQEVAWKQEPIMMFGRTVMQPRLTAWYGDPGKAYSYSGITMAPAGWTPALFVIKERIEKALAATFNSALLNQYRDGNDSVGWHRDNEKELGENPVIASVSFGAARTFHFKHSREKLKVSIVLEPGSLLLMKGTTQHHWHHSIPRTQKPIGSRINITFRSIVL